MSQPVQIHGPAGQIESIVCQPDRPAKAIAIICHPHPLHGGTMNNKVVTTLAKGLVYCGAIVARFNYRGVGQSEGQFDHAVGECDDARAVMAWLQEAYPNLPVWVAGFSFGAYIAMRVSQDHKQVERCIGIAPAIAHYAFDDLTHLHCPWLIVQGDQDDIAPPVPVKAWWQSAPKNTHQDYIEVPGAGHFFHGRLIELRDTVVHWLDQVESGVAHDG